MINSINLGNTVAYAIENVGALIEFVHGAEAYTEEDELPPRAPINYKVTFFLIRLISHR